jgi:hypothetical protein
MYFIRKYILDVGAPVDFESVPKGELISLDKLLDEDIIIKRYTFKENNLRFNIKKNNKEDSNQAVFAIFNPSKSFISFLNANQGDKMAVRFYAGYEDNIKELFSGTLSFFSDTFKGEDRIVELACNQGAVQWQEARTKRTFNAGTSYQEIVDSFIADMKVIKDGVMPFEGSIPVARTYNGPTCPLLKELVNDMNASFTIDDGNSIQIVEKDKHREEVYIPVITKDSGLIGDVDMWDDNADTKPKDKSKKKTGYKAKVFLDGGYKINTAIYLESRTVNSGERTKFKVEKVEHTGEYRGESWETVLYLKGDTAPQENPSSGLPEVGAEDIVINGVTKPVTIRVR